MLVAPPHIVPAADGSVETITTRCFARCAMARSPAMSSVSTVLEPAMSYKQEVGSSILPAPTNQASEL